MAPTPVAQPAAAPNEALRLSPCRHRQQPARGRGLPFLQQAAGDRRRQIRRLCAHHAGREVGAARGRRPPLHRRPHLRPGLHRADAGGLPGQRRRQAQRRKEGRRGAGRPPGGRHPAGQGLHPAARHDGRPADHHHQRLQGRHRGLPRQRAGDRPFRQRSLRRELPRLRADHRVVVAAQLAERHQRRPPVARHDGSAQPAQPAGDHRLPDPRDDQGLEARRLFRRGVERRQAAVAQLRR